MMDYIQNNTLFSYAWSAALIFVAIVLAKAVQIVLVKLFRSKRLFHGELTRCIIDEAHRPLLWLLTVIFISAMLPFTYVPEPWLTHMLLWLRPLSVAIFGWFVIGAARGTGNWLEGHYSTAKSRDALGTRRFTTQIRILMRVVVSVIIVLTLVGMAMVVPALRQLGMSLFASAGVAGIVLGIAAKESFSNLIAGAQLALTQQILLGDSVVVNNQTGTIEEITSSYVVMRTWDLRRIVIPLRFFMENEFENLTYHETNMYGPVNIYADYMVDVDALRAEGKRIVEQSKWWDGKRYEIMVTDSRELTLLLRVAVSAKDSADLWNLQCEMREKLINYLKTTQPWALPKSRGEQKPVEDWKQTVGV